MRILITGGSGFLGRNLIERLARDGHELSCLDRVEASFLKDFGVKTFTGDVFERQLVREAVAGQAAIVHLACTVIPKTSNDDPYFDLTSNVGGAIRLLDATVSAGVGRFVFVSSGGTVYGVPERVPIAETHPTNPKCSYGITRLTIEKYLRLYHQTKGLSTCALRLANPYGEHQRYRFAQGVIPVFCYQALMGESVEIWGDGSVKRDFLHVDDAVEAIARALARPEATGEINIGGGRTTSIAEIVDLIEREVGHALKRVYRPARAFDVPVSWLDISRARQVLGWEPMVGLPEGIRRTLAFIRSEIGPCPAAKGAR